MNWQLGNSASSMSVGQMINKEPINMTWSPCPHHWKYVHVTPCLALPTLSMSARFFLPLTSRIAPGSSSPRTRTAAPSVSHGGTSEQSTFGTSSAKRVHQVEEIVSRPRHQFQLFRRWSTLLRQLHSLHTANVTHED